MEDQGTRLLRVFVVGSPRSGTTIAQAKISKQANLYTQPETNFFLKMVGNHGARTFSHNRFRESFWIRQKYRTRQALRLATPRDWSDLEFIPKELNNRRVPMRDIAREFVKGFDTLATTNGLSGWLEKTPDHLHYLDEIQRYIPDARIVHIIRDGRDSIASRKHAAQVYGAQWHYFYFNNYWNINRQNVDIEKSAEYTTDERHLFVDYHTFCDHTSESLKVILEHIGGPQLITQRLVGEPATFKIADETEKWKANAINGIVEKTASKWLTVFSDEERAEISRLLLPIPDNLQESLNKFNERVDLLKP